MKNLHVCVLPPDNIDQQARVTARATVLVPVPTDGEAAVRLWLHFRPELGDYGVHYGALEVVRTRGCFLIKQTIERTTVLQDYAATAADILVEAKEHFRRTEEALQAAAREMNRAWAAAELFQWWHSRRG